MNAPRFRLLRPDGEARDARLSRTEATLQATARQQEAVAHLGQQALAGAPVRDLMDAAVGFAARVLEVEFASVLEFRPESRTLVLRAGVGWGDTSRVIIPADADSHAGYTLRAAGHVLVVVGQPRQLEAARELANGPVEGAAVAAPPHQNS